VEACALFEDDSLGPQQVARRGDVFAWGAVPWCRADTFPESAATAAEPPKNANPGSGLRMTSPVLDAGANYLRSSIFQAPCSRTSRTVPAEP
jgi:hypothetical protein